MLWDSLDSLHDMPGAPFASLVLARSLSLSGRAVLLAFDGSPGSDAAAHIALALATSRQARIHVVHVEDDESRATRGAQLDRRGAHDVCAPFPVSMQQPLGVQAALSATLTHAVDWPVRIMRGAAATAIDQEARRIGAVLIVVGLQRHGGVPRSLHDETALTVIQHAACPVLAVVPGMTELPQRVLGAVDFSEPSLRAAREATAVMRDAGCFVLAHVAPLTGLSYDDGELRLHELGVQAGFARTAEALKREGITFDHVVLHQDLPRSRAEMLIEYAYATRTDLIAAGSKRRVHGAGWTLGSVGTELVRHGRQSLLIVPPSAGSVPFAVPHEDGSGLPASIV
jgi:nucleotide-binding universal stress UspA family protein